ncbi:spore cortex-lytic enzyme [Ornithinibacillus bavariensis]|uniref:Spore cortex-lytic enzyme n=1 Tax=Ornithinibacillus bavariensis TaxID=545502 RepID=A0A919X9H0_9BACI|nr:spore cortex-lytic enzyme [Ornithinibacillus bavariensis]GIO28472.1 spore cortex-lytic enzyme [Ornithinibacillus bavariensis]HAM81199.1 spore cortex-lytic enzyme [Ornithinibacillus sp.]
MNSKKFFLLLIICLLVIGLQGTSHPNSVDAFTNQVIQRGAVGNDVIELQARLQYIGYYRGKIDGVFGWGTYWALRNFQNDYGLDIDGLAGLKTRQKLVSVSRFDGKWVHTQIAKGNDFTYYGGTDLNKQVKPKRNTGGRANTTPSKQQPKTPTPNTGNNTANTPQTTPAVNVPQGYSQNDINLMANAVHGESRGEPYEGQVAVAAVILNRVESALFPNTVSGVIFEPRAFTAVADGQIWLTPNEQSKQAVLDAINGWDPTGGAIYYFNPETATSSWIWGRPQIKQIGKHIFCK